MSGLVGGVMTSSAAHHQITILTPFFHPVPSQQNDTQHRRPTAFSRSINHILTTPVSNLTSPHLLTSIHLTSNLLYSQTNRDQPANHPPHTHHQPPTPPPHQSSKHSQHHTQSEARRSKQKNAIRGWTRLFLCVSYVFLRCLLCCICLSRG